MLSSGDVVAIRRYAGETYKFIYNETVSWVTGDKMRYFTCETPENAFGYPDTVLVDMNAWKWEDGRQVFEPRAYTLHRYLPPWILKRIRGVILRLTEQLAI